MTKNHVFFLTIVSLYVFITFHLTATFYSLFDLLRPELRICQNQINSKWSRHFMCCLPNFVTLSWHGSLFLSQPAKLKTVKCCEEWTARCALRCCARTNTDQPGMNRFAIYVKEHANISLTAANLDICISRTLFTFFTRLTDSFQAGFY